ncbi:hypothetical protein [Stakelama tenebrarum]|uniref:Uncharacterized protein n=1 Tax=Stakelama tenebrarum TaxID=2711215 RepID=A0A6G6Y8T5_9SPHN|nr:hypothetical protein [Sphingosinithalassobacter tenebrarum]QIG81329.1 hypothetical protein G5C33_17100 [Sphingosinithalassobacter tenebrarum]
MIVNSTSNTIFPHAMRPEHPRDGAGFGEMLDRERAARAPATVSRPPTQPAAATHLLRGGVASPVGDISRSNVDLDTYFDPPPPGGLAQLPPLLLPTAANVAALSQHASARFQGFLAAAGIPQAPSHIDYGTDGAMQLPDDYPYADALRDAFAEDPAMARELNALHGIADTYEAIKPSLAFSEEYGAAKNKAAADAILARYSELFDDNRRYPEVVLNFAADGALLLSSGGKPVQLEA